MSTMPSQLFSQNLQGGMDHYIQQQNLRRAQDAQALQADALELQREGESRRMLDQAQDDAFRRDQLKETGRYHDILDRNRDDELELRRQAAEAKSLLQAQESQAASYDFADLMGREQAARFTASDAVGPPPDGAVGMDDPRVQNFGGLSGIAQRAIRDRKLREVEKLELEASGRSKVQSIRRQRDAAEEALKGINPSDHYNYLNTAARAFRFNQMLDEVENGMKPSTGTPEGFNRFADLTQPKPSTSPDRPNAALASELAQMELERAVIAEALAKKTEPGWFSKGGDPVNNTIMVGKGQEVSRAVAEQRLKSLDDTINYMKRGALYSAPQNTPMPSPAQPAPMGAGPAPMQAPAADATPEQEDQIADLVIQGMSYDEARVRVIGR